MPRLRVIGTASIVFVTSVPLVSHAAQAPTITCRSRGNTALVGEWQVFAPPVFQPGAGVDGMAQGVTAYAVDPRKPLRVFATNGNSVQASDDGGCSWSETLTLPAVPDPNGVLLPGGTTRITSIAIDGTGAGTVWLTAEEGASAGTAGRPHVVLSSSGDPGTWALGDQGLPPVGHPLRLKPAPASGRVVYLTFSSTESDAGLPGSPAPPPGLLWGSTDGGRTWSARTDGTDLDGATQIRDFSVDEADPTGRTLWVAAGGQLLLSRNGGATFDPPDGLEQGGLTITAVDALPAGEPFSVVAYSSTAQMVGLRRQGGWRTHKTHFGFVQSAAHRPGEIAVAATASGTSAVYWSSTYRLDWTQITPPGGLGTSTPDLRTAGTVRPTYYAKTPQRIYRYIGPPDKVPPPDDDGVTDAEVGDPPPVRGTLTPASTTITIPPGQSRTVDYTVALPKSPTPVDLFLLIDTSGSMSPIIDELKANLLDVAETLTEQGVSVRVGAGVIGVQPTGSGPPPIDNPTTAPNEGPRPLYERRRKVGPFDAEFRKRFGEILAIEDASGSGHEAQLEALYQIATGRGLRVNDLLPAYSIPPGQDARWRSGQQVLRVILHATDERFSHDIIGGHNSDPEVAAVLRGAGILQVGLSGGEPKAHADLQKMARLTGATAPAKGVDCNGDGYVEIRRGEALVCPGTEGQFDRMLLSMLEAISDRKAVIVQTSSSPVIGRVSRTSFVVDVKQPARLQFAVTYDCRGRLPSTYPVDLFVRLRESVVARGAASVTCGSPRAAGGNPPVIPVSPPHQANPQLPPVPPPPAQPVTQVQSQPQTQINPQAGSAAQEQDELQLAGVTSDLAADDSEQLAMVGLAAGLLMAAAAGVVLTRQRRTALARAVDSRDRRGYPRREGSSTGGGS